MPEVRSSHTATLLPNGKVLVAGGNRAEASAIAKAALYDPATGTWTSTDSLAEARLGHIATLLPNGKVLVAGGNDINNKPLASATLYNPATGTWSATASMLDSRFDPTAILLPNGKVLVVGGSKGTWNDPLSFVASAELYTPDSPDSTITANTMFCLFNWAEKNYPSLFSPAAAPTENWNVYTYRYYSATKSYLGVSSTDSHVYYIGSDGVFDEGPASYWLPIANCQ